MSTKYKTTNGWTKETMKNQVRLKNNGTKASSGNGDLQISQYRTPDGNACGIGCFIDDNVAEVLQPRSIHKILADTPSIFKFMPLEDNFGLHKFQRVHDSAMLSDGEDMRDRLCNWIDDNVVDA